MSRRHWGSTIVARILGLSFKWTYVLLVGAFLVLPTIVVCVLSFSSASILSFPPPGYGTRWYEHFFDSSNWTSAAVTSLQLGVLATLSATVLGTLTALALVRGRFRGRGLVNALVLSPVIFPSVIVALAMFVVSLRLFLTGTLIALVLAHTALALPFVVVNVTASLRLFDRNLELAARSCGAGPLRTFMRITLPLIWPGVAAGALFAFMTSWDEVIVAFFLSTPSLQTLPVVIYTQITQDIDPTVAAASTMVTGVSLAMLGLAYVALRWSSRLRTPAT